jgi:hypothetical protein
MADIREASFWQKLLEKLLKVFARNMGARKDAEKHQHVVPHEDGWAVRGEGNSRVTATYRYQDDAIARARRIAKNYGSDVVIHGRDGRIRDRMSKHS